MSSMSLRNQTGAINALLLSLIAVVLLLVGAMVFGFWAYGQSQDYKNNVDAKVAVAVESARQAESAAKEKEFAERIKNPYKTYVGPSEYGTITLKYPRTWSAYVSDRSDNDPFVDGYFAPNSVPDVQDENSKFALRLQVVQEPYNEVLDELKSQGDEGTNKVQPYKLPKVPSVVGSRVTGAVEDDKKGVMVLLPMRDKTLKVWTTADQYANDFNKIILPNLKFSP